MESFLAALAGALVGGIASTLGSLIVSRRTHARSVRARIYDELLPDLMRVATHAETRITHPDSREMREALSAVQVAAHVVGGRDGELINEAHQAYLKWQALNFKRRVQDEYGEPDVQFEDEDQEEEYWKLGATFAERVYEYRRWVRRQLAKRL